MKNLPLSFLVALLLGAATTQVHAQSKEVEAVINGLRPAVSLEGAPPTLYTLTDEMRKLHVPGVSIAVIHDGKVAWSQGFGIAGPSGHAVTSQTMFQAGSVSKPVAAMAALHLVDEGKLSLDTPVNDTLKSWKLPDNAFTKVTPVTLRLLLSHTAGTTVHGFQGYAADQKVPPLVSVLNGIPPANSPPVVVDQPVGTNYRYSGGGYAIVQQMMIDSTGKTFPDILDQTVLKPIGMSHSSFSQPLDQRFQNVAQPFDNKGVAIAGGAHSYPEMAAAGLWTTAPDLAAYVLEVQKALNGKSNVLSVAMAREMLKKGKGDSSLAFRIGGSDKGPYFYHDGSNAGYKATIVGYAYSGDGAVILTNGDQGFQLGNEILRSVAAAYNWPDFHSIERRAVTLPTSQLAPFAGTFTIPDLGDFEIRMEGDQLVAEIWKGVVDPLYASSPKDFFLTSQALQLNFTDADHGTISLDDFHAEFARAHR
ncbi:serine hydrolase [Asticcacaulis sp. 201]|uniref:serine hydrolase n=1 Tax=Asticcacaulis sp. 201 TaxID=3028787 RepID=UPI002916975D|nr:serine hydrolase [Asticcacaulis sp. 201]MDV6330944.1 serine hydrolase [Asticcacaulis sp. 201]